MQILTNITADKKDLVKANNAVVGFKDCIGEVINMKSVIIYTKEELDEKTGVLECKTVSAIKKGDGEFITSISPTVKNSLDMIVNTYSAEEIQEGVEVMIKSKKSNGGREFIYIDLV